LNLNNMRNIRYRDRASRLELSTFMQDLIKTQFPYSTTKNVLLAREEREKSYILEKVPEVGLHHREAESLVEKGVIWSTKPLRSTPKTGRWHHTRLNSSCNSGTRRQPSPAAMRLRKMVIEVPEHDTPVSAVSSPEKKKKKCRGNVAFKSPKRYHNTGRCFINGERWSKYRSAVFDHDFQKKAKKPSLSKMRQEDEW
ncbi:hypothetical protein DAPPUDRAFT_123207, partial [Daphnia pulex]